MVEGYENSVSYRYLTVTEVGDAFIEYCEKPQKLDNPYREKTIKERYQAKSGDASMTKFREIANKVRGSKMTQRNAAQTLGLSRRNFKFLLQRNMR